LGSKNGSKADADTPQPQPTRQRALELLTASRDGCTEAMTARTPWLGHPALANRSGYGEFDYLCFLRLNYFQPNITRFAFS
jgi:hypothetical protein